MNTPRKTTNNGPPSDPSRSLTVHDTQSEGLPYSPELARARSFEPEPEPARSNSSVRVGLIVLALLATLCAAYFVGKWTKERVSVAQPEAPQQHVRGGVGR